MALFTIALYLLYAWTITAVSGSCQLANDYDYIVVGGGTSGLVVANRLSEVANITVLVIEAGGSVYDNTDVSDPDGYGRALGTAIDWQYKTVPQKFGDSDVQTLHAAKALGGTSTINGMAYTRAEAAQIDAWEEAGNSGWNWQNLYPYYLKSEQYQTPTQKQMASGATYISEYHGSTGPLKVGYPNSQAVNNFPTILNASYETLGLPFSPDVNGGNMHGFNVFPKTVDVKANIRCDAARAYYWPIAQRRSNLHLLLNSTASRVLLEYPEGSQGDVTASGVEVSGGDGVKRVLIAKREIILSAGALRTPSILELSGIGNPDILTKAGIHTLVPLLGVGENLVDQNNNGLTFDMTTNQDYSGSSGYVSYPNVTDIFGSSASKLASSILKALPSYASAIATQNNDATGVEDILSLLKIQHSLIFDAKVPVAEILLYPLSNSIGSQFWSTLPFARGNVHVKSPDPKHAAEIDPKYFMLTYDVNSQIEIARWVRKLFATGPLAGIAGTETWPGTNTVEANANYTAWTAWIKRNYRGNYHLLSSAIMLPREKGGVVSERLKVYGTTNLRVVDASIFPFQVCGHLMSTLYAVAERASDLIKEDGGLGA